MQNLFSQLWNDDEGIVALEYLILATILGLGLIVGISTFTTAMVVQWVELANVVGAFDHTISSPGFSTCVSSTLGFNGTDQPDLYTLGINIGPVITGLQDLNHCSAPNTPTPLP